MNKNIDFVYYIVLFTWTIISGAYLRMGGGCWAAPTKLKFQKHGFFKIQWYQTLYVIYPWAEISHWNQLMSSTVEFEKPNLKT